MEEQLFTKQGKLWTAIITSVVSLFSLCAGWWLLFIPCLITAGVFWVLYYQAATRDAQLIAEDTRYQQQAMQQPIQRSLLPQAPPQKSPDSRGLFLPDPLDKM